MRRPDGFAEQRQKTVEKSQETVAVKRALMESVDRRVLLIDHSTFGKRELHPPAPLTDFELVIVDSDTAEPDLDTVRSQGVSFRVADDPA